MEREAGRQAHQLRTLTIQRRFTTTAPGSVLLTAGRTMVWCSASVENRVPPWLVGTGKGWITAEYNMLPGSTQPRKPREREGKVDGRTTEIQRLIGRSLRAVADLTVLGERQITVDCEVLQADGGTRTACITGAFIALVDALATVDAFRVPGSYPLRDSVAAVSIGVVDGEVLVDLDYAEDFAASVDMNVVMTGSGHFVEVQGTGEESTFDETQLQQMLAAARVAIRSLTQWQQAALDAAWPF